MHHLTINHGHPLPSLPPPPTTIVVSAVNAVAITVVPATGVMAIAVSVAIGSTQEAMSEGIAADFGLAHGQPVGAVVAASAQQSLEEALGLDEDLPLAEALLQDLGLDIADGQVGNVGAAPVVFAKHAPRSRNKIPRAVEHMSSLFQSLASKARKKTANDAHADRFQRLAAAWDQRVLRHGDRAQVASSSSAPPSSQGRWTHGNTFTVGGLVRAAFCGVGMGTESRSLYGEVDIDKSGHQLEMMETMAGVAHHLFKKKAEALLRALEPAKAIVCCRFHDGTPMLLRFGKLVSRLVSSARYLKLVVPPPDAACQQPRWTTVPYEQYVAENPGRSPQMGVLEVFGQWGEAGDDS